MLSPQWRWMWLATTLGNLLTGAGLLLYALFGYTSAAFACVLAAAIVFAFGATRSTVHARRWLEATSDRLRKSEHLAALGANTVGFAHEMKNGLTVAHGFATLSLRSADGASPALKAQLEILEQQTAELTRQLRSFLALTQPDGALKSPQRIALRSALEHTAKLISPLVRLKELQFECDLDAMPDHTVLEPDFRQALLNLGLNAIEYASKSVRVRVAPTDEGIRVVVEDDGPGVAPQDRHLLFTPFFSRGAQGSGVGLTQAHDAIVREGGTLVYEDVAGGGARFEVRLPSSGVVASHTPDRAQL